MKRFPIIILAIMLCLALMPVKPLAASAQAMQQNLIVEPVNITDEAEYIELLIKMDENDTHYAPCNEENMKQYSFDKTALAKYSTDGFVSFSYHYRDLDTELFTAMRIDRERLDKNGWTSCCFTCVKDENGELSGNLKAMAELKNSDRVMKVAVLDKSGNIIQVSEQFEVSGKKGDIDASVKYDVGGNVVEVSHDGDRQPFMPAYALLFLWNAAPMLVIGIAIAVFLAAGVLIILLVRILKKEKNKR